MSGEDVTFSRLQRLPLLQPDAARSTQVQVRCRALLAHQHLSASSPPVRAGASSWVPAVVFGLSFACLSATVLDLMRVYLRR